MDSPCHVVIIGAARSGTKIFRDALAEAAGVGKVPYDIGYVWRVGQESLPHDVVPPESLSESNRSFIRNFVDRYAAGQPPAVIEKTVGNALRVPEVQAVFPDAAYVHLVRDGVDVIESTRRQWQAPTDLRYLAAKARHFPLRLIPRYGMKYVGSLARRRVRGDGRIGSWGVRYPGIDADLVAESLLTVCCRQWREAVVRARADLAMLRAPCVEVRYERFIENPTAELDRVGAATGLQLARQTLPRVTESITAGRHGIGRTALTPDELQTVDAEVGDLLAELGYPRPVSAPADEHD